MIRFDIRHYDRVGSTNDEALRLAEAGAPHGTVVTANMQTAGRGRQGRTWTSPPGNVYVSIVLRPDAPVSRFGELSFVAALAVADTIDAFVPGRTTLKWPNDVLVGGAKIAGILLEQAENAVIAGIGLNVLHELDDTRYAATSLARAGATKLARDSRDDVAAVRVVLLDAFAHRLSAWQRVGFAPVRAEWLQRAHPLGTMLRVTIGSATITGAFAGLAGDGTLLLDTGTGLRHIAAGDVTAG